MLRRLLPSAFVLFAACSSTDGPAPDRPEGAEPAQNASAAVESSSAAEASVGSVDGTLAPIETSKQRIEADPPQDAGDAASSSARSEPDSVPIASIPSWPALDEIEALIDEVGAVRARSALRRYVRREFEEDHASAQGAELEAFESRVIDLAERLADSRSDVQVRRLRYAERSLTHGVDAPLTWHAGHKLARALVRAGTWSEAQQLFAELTERAEACGIDATDRQLLVLDQGLGHASAQEYDQAERALGRVLDGSGVFEELDFDRRRQVLGARAEIARARGDLDSSLDLVEQLVQLELTVTDAADPRVVQFRNGAGRLASQSGDHRRAAQLLRSNYEALDAAHGSDDSRVDEALFDLSVALFVGGDLDASESAAREVYDARLALHGAHDPRSLQALDALAAIHGQMGRVQSAFEFGERALETSRQLYAPTDPRLLRTLGNLASTASELGRDGLALELREEIVAALESSVPPDHLGRLTETVRLAEAQQAAGAIEAAILTREQVDGVLEHLSSVPAELRMRAGLGKVQSYRLLGQPRQALDLLQQLQDDHGQALASRRTRAAFDDALTQAHVDSGQVRQALAVQERVVSANQGTNPLEVEARTAALGWIAKWRLALGDVVGARSSTLELGILLRGLDGPRTADVLGYVRLCQLLGSGDEAPDLELLEWLGETTPPLPSDGPIDGATLEAQHMLALAWADADRLDEAEKIVAALLESARIHGGVEGRHLARLISHLAALQVQIHGPAFALQDFDRNVADSRAEQGSDAIGAALLASTATHLMLAAGENERLPTAGARWLEALAAVGSSNAALEPRLARLESQLISKNVGHWLALREFFPDGGRSQLVAVLEVAARAHWQIHGWGRRWSWNAGGDHEALRQALQAVHTELVHAGADSRVVVELALERDRLLAEYTAMRGDASTVVDGSGIEGVQARLQATEAVLVIQSTLPFDWAERGGVRSQAQVSSERYVGFYVTADTVELLEFGAVEAFDTAVASWRTVAGVERSGVSARGIGGLGGGKAAGDSPASAEPVLLQALETLWARTKGVERLYVVPDGSFHDVPIDALRVDGSFIGDACTIVVLPSLFALAVDEDDVEHRPEPSLLLVGGLDFDGPADASASGPGPARDPDARGALTAPPRFAPLPGSHAEVDAIRVLHAAAFDADAVVLVGSNAKRERVVHELASARFVHLATHGWAGGYEAFQPGADGTTPSVVGTFSARAQGATRAWSALEAELVPELSCGLALSGANHDAMAEFTAEELRYVDLEACELVVLSACRTSLGVRTRGLGDQSLQSALHAAGARTAITSLWKVDDAATRRLFELFYTALWQDGVGKADALWRAKMALREEGHPVRDWAGWVLTGDPD